MYRLNLPHLLPRHFPHHLKRLKQLKTNPRPMLLIHPRNHSPLLTPLPKILARLPPQRYPNTDFLRGPLVRWRGEMGGFVTWDGNRWGTSHWSTGHSDCAQVLDCGYCKRSAPESTNRTIMAASRP